MEEIIKNECFNCKNNELYIQFVYLKYIKSVAYAAKNHINCACVDGIPYSAYRPSLFIGLASQIVCFNTKFIPSLMIIPIKNTI